MRKDDEVKRNAALKENPRGRNSLHCKKSLSIFPAPAGMSLTKLSLAGKKLIISGMEFGQ
jgi:hypothetical protein